MREWAELADDERAILLGDKRLGPGVPRNVPGRPNRLDLVDPTD